MKLFSAPGLLIIIFIKGFQILLIIIYRNNDSLLSNVFCMCISSKFTNRYRIF